jgi:hypothetical protein
MKRSIKFVLLYLILTAILSQIVAFSLDTGQSVAYAFTCNPDCSFSTQFTIVNPEGGNIFTLGYTDYEFVIYMTQGSTGYAGYAIVGLAIVYPLNAFWDARVQLWTAQVSSKGTIVLLNRLADMDLLPGFGYDRTPIANLFASYINNIISITINNNTLGAAQFNGYPVKIYATPGLQISYSSSSSTTSTATAGYNNNTTATAGNNNNITIPGGYTISEQKFMLYMLVAIGFLFLLIIIVAIARR